MQRKHHVHAHQPQRSSHFHCWLLVQLWLILCSLFWFLPTKRGTNPNTSNTPDHANMCKRRSTDSTQFPFHFRDTTILVRFATKNDAKTVNQSATEWVCAHSISAFIRLHLMISRVWVRFHAVCVCECAGKWVCSHNRVHAIYYYIIINAVEKEVATWSSRVYECVWNGWSLYGKLLSIFRFRFFSVPKVVVATCSFVLPWRN